MDDSRSWIFGRAVRASLGSTPGPLPYRQAGGRFSSFARLALVALRLTITDRKFRLRAGKPSRGEGILIGPQAVSRVEAKGRRWCAAAEQQYLQGAAPIVEIAGALCHHSCIIFRARRAL